MADPIASPSSPSPAPSTPVATPAPPAAASPPAVTAIPTSTPAPPARPEWAPENFWDTTKGELKHGEFKQHLDGLTAFKAAEDSRKLSVPKPTEYKLEFAPDYTLPQGIEWKWDDEGKSPLIGQAREYAAANGINQEGFSKLLGLYAASRVGEIQQLNTAKAAELGRLGENANARVDAVRTWLKSVGGSDFDGLNRVLEMAPTAATVAGLEKLIQKFTSQGSGSYSGAHREVNQPERVSNEAYSKMTYSEKKEYASKFGMNGATP